MVGLPFVFYSTHKNENLNKCYVPSKLGKPGDENQQFFGTSELIECCSVVAPFLFLLKDLLMIIAYHCFVGATILLKSDTEIIKRASETLKIFMEEVCDLWCVFQFPSSMFFIEFFSNLRDDSKEPLSQKKKKKKKNSLQIFIYGLSSNFASNIKQI